MKQDLVLVSTANALCLSDANLAKVEASLIGTIEHPKKGLKKVRLCGVPPTRADRNQPEKPGKTASSTSVASTSTAKPDLKRKASSASLAPPVKEAKASTSSSKAISSEKVPAGTSKKEVTPVATKGKTPEKTAKSTPQVLNGANAKTASSQNATQAKGKEKEEANEDEYAALLADDDDLMAEIEGTGNSKRAEATKSDLNAAVHSKSQGAPEEKVLQSKKGARKTRTVKKKVVTTNAKGFKVTKEVETDESYTASENEAEGPTVASKPIAKKSGSKDVPKAKDSSSKAKPDAPVSSSSKAKAKPGEQMGLKNFFGKPKAAKK